MTRWFASILLLGAGVASAADVTCPGPVPPSPPVELCSTLPGTTAMRLQGDLLGPDGILQNGQLMIGTSIPQPSNSRAWSGSGRRHPIPLVVPSGSGTAAREPIISSGQGAGTSSASHSTARASSASARLRAINVGHPPSTSEPR